MFEKSKIIKSLQLFNYRHESEGFKIYSLFGSYARDTNDVYSDIDLTYKVNHDLFFKDDAFAKLAKIEDLKKELENTFHIKVDLIPANTKNYLLQESIQKEQILV